MKIGSNVLFYNTGSRIVADETTVESTIIKGKREANGNVHQDDNVPYSAYPWIASVVSTHTPYPGYTMLTTEAIVGWGRVFRYVSNDFWFGSDSKDVWLDEEGTIWIGGRWGVFLYPFSSWGYTKGELKEFGNVGRCFRLVLGNDLFYLSNGTSIFAYDRKTFEFKWSRNVGGVSNFYYDGKKNLLVIAGGMMAKFLDGTDGSMIAMIPLWGESPDVTKDKDGNYWFLSVSHLRCYDYSSHSWQGYYFPECFKGVSHWKYYKEGQDPYHQYTIYKCPYPSGTNPCPTRIKIVHKDELSIINEKTIYGLGEEHSFPLGKRYGGATSISTNANGDIAVGGCNPSGAPLLFLAKTNYRTCLGGTSTDCDYYCYTYDTYWKDCPTYCSNVKPLGGQHSFLIARTITASQILGDSSCWYSARTFDRCPLGFYDSRSQAIQWAGEFAPERTSAANFSLGINGDGGLVTHLIWERNWKPFTKAIYYYLFGPDGIEQ
ncbi:MAG: hypothetical protein DRP01_05445 [Archaeoglobales archaeon]|nr:MAG: hypothetical protein DRP01_05445 [Archaeoglobales archaeon]